MQSLDQAKAIGQPASEASGLVPYTTSGTSEKSSDSSASFLEISQALARVQRMKHHLRTAGRLVAETIERAKERRTAYFVTLTYANGDDWSGRDVSDFLKRVREWARRRGFRVPYVWCAETQKRGAIHYHLVMWLPKGQRMPKPDKCGWWARGFSNVQRVKKNAVGYLMKYVSKGKEAPKLPKGSRICGSGGLDADARAEFHYWRLPRYVRENLEIGQRAERVEGGGWRRRGGAEVWKSAFGLFGMRRCEDGDKTQVLTNRAFNRFAPRLMALGGEYIQRWAALSEFVREAWARGMERMRVEARPWEVEAARWEPEQDCGQWDYETRVDFLIA